jgi:FkbM family methyltransferase
MMMDVPRYTNMRSAEYVVVGIIRAALGGDGSVSGDKISQAARQLASPRDTQGAHALALFCQQFLNGYKNWNYDIRSNGERWLLNRIAAFQPAIIFDVGANLGEWLMVALEEMPNVRVHAFEIIESTSAALSQRIIEKPSVILNRFGLSDHSGVIKMHAFDVSNTLASHVAYPHGSYREHACPVRRGDDYMRENAIVRIDFLKIDVEGAEHLVLSGFSQALEAGQIEVIQFEYGRVNIITHFLLRDFYELLEAKGYAVGKIYPDHVDFRSYALEDEDFLGPNYLAVRRTRTDIIDALRKR